MKKFMIIFVLMFSFLSFTGCGNDNQIEEGEDIEEIEVEEEDEIGDGEINDEYKIKGD